MIDVHCHLEHEEMKKNIEDVIQRCRFELKALVSSCPHPRDFDFSLKLGEKFKNYVFVCLGLHPEYIEEFNESVVSEFENLVRNNLDKIVAIGEIGLDYFWVRDEKLRERQRELFSRLVDFAKKINKPIVVHIREAYEDAIKILKDSDYQKVLLHMFGGEKFIEEVMSNEWKISVGPILLRSKSHKKIVKKIPLERIMLETDSPWMKIEGRPAFPTDVKLVAQKIAEVKKVEVSEVEEATDKNSIEFFDLKLTH